ncbi:MAG: HupE / UreJ family protein [Rhodospirillales bacterium]|jgi:urease accessory protein|nr:HupE / UreJ family protein [Rhodospirillales bacterium]MDB5384048.1 HupE / UreJ family protein [Rhodospirillales bacterium]
MIRVFAALVLMLPFPALAHHPSGGLPPASLWEGIASGIAHPILGLDHLAFLLAAGLLLSAAPRALIAFLGAALGGALLHRAGWGLGPVEVVVAASVIVAGAVLVVAGRARPAAALLIPAFALAGLFHGHALAEAAVASPALVFAGYLAMLTVMQTGIALGAMVVARCITGALPFRAAGFAAMAIGIVFLAA